MLTITRYLDKKKKVVHVCKVDNKLLEEVCSKMADSGRTDKHTHNAMVMRALILKNGGYTSTHFKIEMDDLTTATTN